VVGARPDPSASPKANLWQEARGWRSLALTAAGLTAVAIALPLALPGAPPIPAGRAAARATVAAPAARPITAPAASVPAAPPAEAPPPRVVYVEKYIQAPAPPAPAPAQPQPLAAQASAPSQATQEGASCNMLVPSVPGALGSGTVMAILTPDMSRANIDNAQAAAHGSIDPAYTNRVAVGVRLDSGLNQVGRLPPGLVAHVGDRVAMQTWYKNTALPCNYIPNMVTADLGPPPGTAPPSSAP
jgi:hypothetical protein